MSDGSRRTVQLMLCVQNEKNVQCPNNLGMRLVVVIGDLRVHHVQKVLNVPKISIGRNDGLADPVSIACGSDCWSTTQNSINVLVSLDRVLIDICTDISWVTLWIERTHGCNQSCHHAHRMGIMAESLDEFKYSVMEVAVAHDLLVECLHLFLIGQFAVDDEEGRLKKA